VIEQVKACHLEKLHEMMKPTYLFWREEPDENGCWLDSIGPDHPQYKEAEKLAKDRSNRFWQAIGEERERQN
jgi:hypothetical protein